jgi:predicted flap endonuclease-1-like 5' DNA nuclease/cell division protein FtsB
MAERFTADLLFILFVLLVAALLGLLIGWLLAKARCRKQIASLEAETENLKARIRKLEDEKNGLNAQLRLLEDEKHRLDARLGLLENEKTSLMAKITDQEEDEQALRGEARRLDDEVDNLQLAIGGLENELAGLRAQLNTAPETSDMRAVADVSHADVLPHFSPENIKPDDLEVVIGIGPKIAKLLMNRGITTWKGLSETAPNYLEAILHEDGGERFRIHNPASWPHQARLLHEGRWDEFRELRDRLWSESR